GVALAALEICRVAVALRSIPFVGLLDRFRLRDSLPAADSNSIEQASRHVRWAHSLIPLDTNRLLDSHAPACLIRRQRVRVPLCIGVRKNDGEVQAHAWLGQTDSEFPGEFQLLFRVPEDGSEFLNKKPAEAHS